MLYARVLTILFYYFSSFAVMFAYSEYSLDIAITEFFSQTFITYKVYNTKVKDLVKKKVVLITV
jgi:hypothetical protein